MKRTSAAVAASLFLAPASASAWCRTTTSDARPSTPTSCVTAGTPLFWSRRCQGFSLDTAAGGGLTLPQVRSAVTAAFGAWNAVDCGDGPIFHVSELATVTCDQAEYSGTDGNSNTVAFIGDFGAHDYPTDAVAITVVWHNTDNGQIYDADMLINEQMGPFATCPPAGCPIGTSAFDLQNVVTHEAGHFLGLAHSADTQATMFYMADPGETSKRTLAQDDVDGICDAYGDGTVPAECDPTPRHGFDADCTVEPAPSDSKGGCGCDLAARDRPLPGVLAGLAALLVTAWRRRSSRGS